MTQLCDFWDLINEQLEIQLFDKLYSNQLIRTNSFTRGIGKSYILAKISVHCNIPIIVPSQSGKYSLMKAFPNAQYLLTNELRGRSLPNGVLLEEGFSMQEIKKIKKLATIAGGYYYDNFLQLEDS